jgi:hypothetical protein
VKVRWIGWIPAVFLVVACATAPRTAVQAPTPTSVEGLASSIAADAQRSEHETDAAIRAQLADDSSRDADACLAREPQGVACLYGGAVSLGLEARAHPTRALELLNKMLVDLTSAEVADPTYDQAGPARVRALVLIRAPGWPLGPGDAAAGLVAARRAVTLRPQYPPNLLALAEAQAKNGDASGARESYAHARDAAQAMPANAERDEWLREADQALQRR